MGGVDLRGDDALVPAAFAVEFGFEPLLKKWGRGFGIGQDFLRAGETAPPCDQKDQANARRPQARWNS